MSKIFANKNNIITVQQETKSQLIGFDVFTETLVVLKKSESIEVTGAISKLLGDEKSQMLIAKNITSTFTEAAKILDVHQRTFMRMMTKHYNQPEI